MYETFYGFKNKPFQIVPNPEYLYKSPKHQNALTYLEYRLSENVGFILLTGEIGSGKTTLIQYILNKIGDDSEATVIFNTNFSPYQLLKMILNEFEKSGGNNNIFTSEAIDIIYSLFGGIPRSIYLLCQAALV
jgi:general secretion pathway protein A